MNNLAKKLTLKPEFCLIGKVEDLVSSNLRLVKSVISKFVRGRIEDSELYSTGCLAMMEAASTFDPTKAKFSTWATRHIKQAVFDQLRKNKKNKIFVSFFEMQEIERDEALIDKHSSSPLHLVALAHPSEQDTAADILNKKMLCLHYLEKKSLSEIAKEFGFTKEGIRKKISRAILQIRKKNKSLLKEHM